MEKPLDQEIVEKKLFITGEMKDSLMTTSRWVQFLSVLGLVSVGGYTLLLIFSTFGKIGDLFDSTLSTMMFLVAGLFYFYPMILLYKYSRELKKSITSNDQYALSEAFDNQRKFFAYVGSIYAIVLVFTALSVASILL